MKAHLESIKVTSSEARRVGTEAQLCLGAEDDRKYNSLARKLRIKKGSSHLAFRTKEKRLSFQRRGSKTERRAKKKTERALPEGDARVSLQDLRLSSRA